MLSVLSAATIILAIAASPPTNAQDADAQGPIMEEITVTARLYEESLQNAPVAVAVMTNDYLSNQKIETIDEIMGLTPGAVYGNFSKVQPTANIRGVNSATPGNSSIEASVQLAVDGVVNAKDFMKAPALYDLERVEVLRGPQGTAFGRNASAGLIHLITRRPTREFEAGVNLTAGNDGLFEVDGFFSGPLSDTLSGRVAYNSDIQDGPTESLSTGEGLDGEQNTSIRGSLLFEPSDNFSAYFKAEYSKDDDAAPVRHGSDCTIPFIDGPRETGFTPPANHPPFATSFFDSCDPFKTEISQGDFFVEREIRSLTAELVWNIGDGLTLTSITGYMDGDSDSLTDVLGTPEDIVFQHVVNDGRFFSEEVRIDNHVAGKRFSWLAGVYLLTDEEDRFEQNQFFQSGLPFPRVPTFLATISSNETDSIAGFGEVSFDLTDRLNLTVGGRATRDERDYDYSVKASGFRPVIAGVEGCTPALGIICGTVDNPVGFDPIHLSDDWDDISGKVSLQYALNDTSTIYALYSEGFKSGGFQHDARNIESALIVADEEESENFEIGWKAQYERARVALTVFHLENEGSQDTALIPVGTGGAFTSLLSNVGGIETDGFEAEGTWLATDHFLVGGTFAVFDTELVDTVLTRGVDNLGNPILEDLSGGRPAGAPEETATLYGEYDFTLGNGSTLTLRGDYQHRSDVFWNTTITDLSLLRPKLNILGARVTWLSADERFRVMWWGKNLGEDVDFENIGPAQPNTFQRPTGFRGKKEYGLTFGFMF